MKITRWPPHVTTPRRSPARNPYTTSEDVTVIAAAIGMQAPVSAQPADPGPPPSPGASSAAYNGRTIDLSKGWQGAVACNVYTPSRVECFDSVTEANRAVGDVTAGQETSFAAAASPYCPRRSYNPDTYWFCLYEHINYEGRTLRFADEYWQSLYPYGFQYKTSSAYNAQYGDNAGLGDGIGDATNFVGREMRSQLGSWNDRAVDVYG